MVAAAQLPRAEILASCYATMRPPENFWNRYVTEIDRLQHDGKVTERDHEVLRFALNAPDELMEVTRGDVDGINETNVHAVLEKLEKSFATDREQELQRERIAHEKTRAILESQIHLDAARAEQQHQQTKHALAEAQAVIVAREQRSHARRERIAAIVANTAFYVFGLVFAAIAVASAFGTVSPIVGIPAAVVGFFNLWTGFSGNVVKRTVRACAERILHRFID
jgi:hypothetical protein